MRTTIDVALPPREAFAVFAEELVAALAARGLRCEPRAGGAITQGETRVGRVTAWSRTSAMLEWHPADWLPDERIRVVLRCARSGGGTRVSVDHQGWDAARAIDDPGELVAWFAGQVIAPLLQATAPAALGDWVTDRGARKPSGARARATYADPLYHYPNFRVILAELALTAADHLLEVGCGGGALLKDALRSGCRAAAIDYSPAMVRLARATNRDAVAAGRLAVVHANARAVPFRTETFTCAAMTAVFGFLPDPVAALAEIHRALKSGGRFVMLGSDPEERGTPAAPEPFASRLRFYTAAELAQVGRAAGFDEVRVERRPLEAFARDMGVPQEHLELFAGPGPSFLFARKG